MMDWTKTLATNPATVSDIKTADIIATMNKMRAVSRKMEQQHTIYCHPDNVPYLAETLRRINEQRDRVERTIVGEFLPRIWRDPLDGVPIKTSEHLPRTINDAEHWTPPRGDRFVEYDRNDHDWAQPLGMGAYELAFYRVDASLLATIPTIRHEPMIYVTG